MMPEFRVEKGVPLPPAPTGSNCFMRSLQVGDSFVWPKKHRRDLCGWRAYWRRQGVYLAIRKIEDGVRIWRIDAPEKLARTPPTIDTRPGAGAAVPDWSIPHRQPIGDAS